eukprot:gnl/MRDRNA2_/MRDRNA2_87713_c0_seq1.p1 gnl/MRDRNA2_/MRDRNA2_87713_c0~~gnl/MRDRNA2_/MRDRNA2_87713_c0_seq1.p1  ORF type:complete len:373 (+),score=58.18 gnl/MRDRNA2_/MRDRNA2_87713_c0_seq1:140-1258(+)
MLKSRPNKIPTEYTALDTSESNTDGISAENTGSSSKQYSDISDLCGELDELLEELDHAVSLGDKARSQEIRETITRKILPGPFDSNAWADKVKEIRHEMETGNYRYKKSKRNNLENRYAFSSTSSGSGTAQLEIPDESDLLRVDRRVSSRCIKLECAGRSSDCNTDCSKCVDSLKIISLFLLGVILISAVVVTVSWVISIWPHAATTTAPTTAPPNVIIDPVERNRHLSWEFMETRAKNDFESMKKYLNNRTTMDIDLPKASLGQLALKLFVEEKSSTQLQGRADIIRFFQALPRQPDDTMELPSQYHCLDDWCKVVSEMNRGLGHIISTMSLHWEPKSNALVHIGLALALKTKTKLVISGNSVNVEGTLTE